MTHLVGMPKMNEDFFDGLLKTGWFERRFTRREVLFAAEEVLSDRYFEIFRLRYMGNDGRGMTYEEVGLKLGLSGPRVGQISQKSLQRVSYFLKHGQRPPAGVRDSMKW